MDVPVQSSQAQQHPVNRTDRIWRGHLWTRRWEAASVDTRMRVPMIVATLLVIPDLIMEEQPLSGSWHVAAQISDWLICLVFLVELAAIMLFAVDRRSWLRRYPLAIAMLVLTPPFAPAAIQGLRAFRLLRLLRVARGFQLLSKLLTLDGVKYVGALVVFLVVGGGTVFADSMRLPEGSTGLKAAEIASPRRSTCVNASQTVGRRAIWSDITGGCRQPRVSASTRQLRGALVAARLGKPAVLFKRMTNVQER